MSDDHTAGLYQHISELEAERDAAIRAKEEAERERDAAYRRQEETVAATCARWRVETMSLEGALAAAQAALQEIAGRSGLGLLGCADIARAALGEKS